MKFHPPLMGSKIPISRLERKGEERWGINRPEKSDWFTNHLWGMKKTPLMGASLYPFIQ